MMRDVRSNDEFDAVYARIDRLRTLYENSQGAHHIVKGKLLDLIADTVGRLKPTEIKNLKGLIEERDKDNRYNREYDVLGYVKSLVWHEKYDVLSNLLEKKGLTKERQVAQEILSMKANEAARNAEWSQILDDANVSRIFEEKNKRKEKVVPETVGVFNRPDQPILTPVNVLAATGLTERQVVYA
jgi:hypothetical protein